MVCEGLQVLHDGCEVELVARAGEASEAHALEAMVGLQVRKSHLDPLPLIAGLRELRRVSECPRMVTGFFVHVAWHFALGYVWTTPRPQRARIAIELARPIEDRATIVHLAGRPQGLTVRTSVLVLLLVEYEVSARERTVIAVGHLPHRDVRRDAGADEPAKELA